MAHLTRFIVYEKLDGYAILRLARPERKNAFVQEMYGAISVYLKQAAYDDEVKVLVFTGTGEYFSSGADLIERDNLPNAEAKKKKSNYFREFVETMVKFPKQLIAAVNGPAIGIGVTCLPLCDVVYAVENATFMTPFSRIAIVPEACSSYTFPKIMGYAKANEMLLFNRMLSADEAYVAGLVTEVFPKDVFVAEVQKRVEEFVDNPIKSLIYGKQLIRGPEIPILLETSERETKRLAERYTSPEFVEQGRKFFEARKRIKEARKAKL